MSQTANSAYVPVPTRIGQTLVQICVACLVIGKGIVAIFFPDRFGQGMDAVAWAILIPIWTPGIIGLLLISVGWVMRPSRDTSLEFRGMKRRPNGRFLSPFTRYLAGITLVLLLVPGIDLMLFAPVDEFSMFQKVMLYFVMIAPSGFVLYLLFGYKCDRHRVVTTYLNDFLFLFAIVLVGVFVPLLVIFSLRERGKSGGVRPAHFSHTKQKNIP